MERVLKDPSKYFWLKSGRALRSLRELANALPSISDDEWRYHVKPEKNDFSIWVRDLFGEHRLSESLRRAPDKKEFQRILYTFLTKETLLSGRRQKEEQKRLHEEELVRNPKAFAQYHEQDSQRKDRLADRFDSFARRFEESLSPETPKEVEKRRDDLAEKYERLRQQVAEARKEGKDPMIPYLLLKRVQSKLDYAATTRREEDFEKVEELLDEAEKELGEAKVAKEPDVRKEIELLVAAGDNVRAQSSGHEVQHDARGGEA